MSALEDHDKRLNRTPLEPGIVFENVMRAERYLERADKNYAVETERTICWLHDRLQAALAVIANAMDRPKVPVGHRCAYCWNAAGRTEEAWHALPAVSYDDACLHAQACEHNPLVQSIARISHDRDAALAQVADLQGRKLGNGDAWAEAASEATGMYEYQRKLHEALKATIRSLLATELPAGDLRKALEELVR